MIRESDYKSLCCNCDKILLENSKRIWTIGNPWLYIIREHPMFLKNYPFFDNFTLSYKDKFRNFLLFFKYLLGWLFHFFKIIIYKKKKFSFSDSSKIDIDILFVSHFINPSQKIENDDFYFGSLPNNLQKIGYRVGIALIDHTDRQERVITNSNEKIDVFRIVLDNSLGFLGDLKLFINSIKEFLYFSANSSRSNDVTFNKVYNRATVEFLSGGSRNTMRLYKQIGFLCNFLKPRSIIVTYEGHAWERMAFLAARNLSPRVKCIAYQHAALFRLQHSIKRPLTKKLDPDVILTSGSIYKKQLEDVIELKGTVISVLGSRRTFSNVKNHLENICHAENETHTCLVLPEGDMSECDILFRFSLECAYRYPDVNFIWRLHPLISFKAIIKNNPFFKNLPKNIILSTSSLENDISKSQYSLYRGSTAIVQAIGSGLKPIYLEVEGQMTIDPLYGIESFKSRVYSVENFYDSLTLKMTNYSINVSQVELQDYCNNLFSKFDIQVIERILKNNNDSIRNSGT